MTMFILSIASFVLKVFVAAMAIQKIAMIAKTQNVSKKAQNLLYGVGAIVFLFAYPWLVTSIALQA